MERERPSRQNVHTFLWATGFQDRLKVIKVSIWLLNLNSNKSNYLFIQKYLSNIWFDMFLFF